MDNRFANHLKSKQTVTGDVVGSSILNPIESSRELQSFRDKNYKKKHFVSTAETKTELDLNFLAAASESYHISSNPKDYIIVPMPIVTVDIPNRNNEAFSLEETSYFDPRYGCMIYDTFKHKPCHKDHVNQDPTKALGVIVDSSLVYVPKFDIWKIAIITIWDRTKDVKRVNEIVNKQINGYSMGAFVDSFSCSICGAMDVNVKPCEHHVGGAGKSFGKSNRLAFKNLLGTCFFEVSSVASPADDTAVSNDVFI